VAHDLKTPLNGILAPIESCITFPTFFFDDRA